MSRDYHKYIYDRAARQITGDFEGAYRDCEDVWPTQHDVHIMKYQWALSRVREKGEDARLLDIGAGYGDFVALAREKGVDATGIEISSTAVEKGLARHPPGLKLMVGDLTEGLPCADHDYDVVVLFGVFWFLLDALDPSMDELMRVMRPDADLFVSVSMVSDPIGKEVMGNYHDFLEILRRHFVVRDLVLCYGPDGLQSDVPLAELATDMVAYCTLPDA